MKCNSVHKQMMAYLDGSADDDSRDRIEAHLKDCSHCSEFLKVLKRSLDQIDEEKLVKPDPYMFTRIMAGLEKPQPAISTSKLQVAFQAIAFIAIIAIGIYSGIITGKNFSDNKAVSVDYQNEIYYLDELQHENMISVFLTDQIKTQ